ncbi:MAG: hypothetical protein QOD43_1364, partial [Gaiellaceae bacterium]|nr:hypothetical protein [Gaiellaceae bacterium]
MAPTWLVQVHIGLGDIGRLEQVTGEPRGSPAATASL